MRIGQGLHAASGPQPLPRGRPLHLRHERDLRRSIAPWSVAIDRQTAPARCGRKALGAKECSRGRTRAATADRAHLFSCSRHATTPGAKGARSTADERAASRARAAPLCSLESVRSAANSQTVIRSKWSAVLAQKVRGPSVRRPGSISWEYFLACFPAIVNVPPRQTVARYRSLLIFDKVKNHWN